MKINIKHIFRQKLVRETGIMLLSVSLMLLTLQLCLKQVHAADAEYPDLRKSIDSKFQAAFEKALDKQFGQDIWDLVKAKKVGIVLADITDPHKPKVAGVNRDVMLYAASLPKIAIVLGAFVQMERGKMTMDDKTRNLLNVTVRKSSNKAATELLNQVGIQNLAEILQSDRYRLYDPEYGGGLWVGRDSVSYTHLRAHET